MRKALIGRCALLPQHSVRSGADVSQIPCMPFLPASMSVFVCSMQGHREAEVSVCATAESLKVSNVY